MEVEKYLRRNELFREKDVNILILLMFASPIKVLCCFQIYCYCLQEGDLLILLTSKTNDVGLVDLPPAFAIRN